MTKTELKELTTLELAGISMMSRKDVIKRNMVESLQNVKDFEGALVAAKAFMNAFEEQDYSEYEISEKDIEIMKIKARAMIEIRKVKEVE